MAVTKADLLDDELINELQKDLPDIPSVFISSLTGKGITALKDLIWRELNN
jgi:GTP-binding protein